MIFAANLADLEPGRGLKLATENGDIAVFKDTTGEVFAIDDRCNHLGASLAQGTCTDGIVDCWLHHGQYSAKSGETLRYPAHGSLNTYPVEIRDGEVWVDPKQA
ncbi:Rieske (2Fe-2S) protein [Corynebacterium lubricantis]|uniref:Rieske (2Fe-2S) protein n=1 Tax=Corynebacterium lubricantis TaxID=541095 RepID=UPI000367A5BD|nr:Rieske 2Fe-2S domain-containing protein [Corynebacterium lubricantis]